MRKLSLPAQVCWPNKHNAANECMHLQAADPSVTTVHHCFRRTPLLTLAVRQPVTDTATPDGSFLLRASSSVVGNCFTMMIKLASAQAPVMSYRIEKVFFRMRARVCVYAYVCVCVWGGGYGECPFQHPIVSEVCLVGNNGLQFGSTAHFSYGSFSH